MRTILYTFSGTGNSLVVAETLAEQLGETSIVSLAKREREKNYISDAERIGFVFPLYFMGMPRIVAEFLGKVDLSQAEYIFAVSTKGFSLSGGALKQAKQILKRRDIKLDGGWLIQMVDNYLPMFTIPENDKIDLINSAGMNNIESIVQKITAGKREIKEGFLSFSHRGTHKKFLKRIGEGKKYLSADEFCTGCGTCAAVCPVNNITLKNKHPEWNSHCEECLACIHHCPMKSVQFEKKPFKNKLYRYPAISLKRLMEFNQ